MPNNTITTEVEIEEFEPDDFGENDFGFILGPDGDLKSFSIPEHLMENPPEEVIMILQLFGIEDVHEITHRTLH